MTKILNKVTADTSTDLILEILDRDGGVIIQQPEEKTTYQLLDSELGPAFDESAFCNGKFYGTGTKRLYSLIAKSEACQKMATNKTVLNIMRAILGSHSEGQVLLNLTQGIEIHPGEREQALHRDDSLYGPHIKTTEHMMNAMWAQNAFTAENGATVIVPGSHKWPQDEQELIGRILSLKDEDKACAEMDAGDVLVYRGSTVHAGGANKDNKPRRGVVLSYCLPWLRQSEPQLLAAPWAIVKDLSDELLDLLGYRALAPNLGLYKGNHPKDVLRLNNGEKLPVSDLLTPEQNNLLDAYYGMKKVA